MPAAPQRMCAACHGRADKKELFRIACIEDKLVLDEGQKLPGRGAYLCRSVVCIDKASKSKALSRALKVPAQDSLFKELKEKLNG